MSVILHTLAEESIVLPKRLEKFSRITCEKRVACGDLGDGTSVCCPKSPCHKEQQHCGIMPGGGCKAELRAEAPLTSF